MTETMLTLANDGTDLVMMAMAGGFLVTILAVTFSIAHSMHRTKQREQTKRELAAYVAEGSMTTDEAERILKAGAEDGSRRRS